MIYVALEGQLGLRTRVQALEHDRGGVYQKGIRYVFDACNVASTEDVDALAVTALKHQAKFIVIDTLSASLAGTAEENSNSAMAGMIANVQRLTRMTGAAVLLVHHSGNDPRRGARGAYALHANPDVSIEVGRNGNERYPLPTSANAAENFVHLPITTREKDKKDMPIEIANTLSGGGTYGR